MNATDIIGYTRSGWIYCASCGEQVPGTEFEVPHPVFGDQVSEVDGDTCHVCGEHLVEQPEPVEYQGYGHTFDMSHRIMTSTGYQYGAYIEWNGSATFNVFAIDGYGRPGQEIDCFTQYEVESEAHALEVMKEWIKDRRPLW